MPKPAKAALTSQWWKYGGRESEVTQWTLFPSNSKRKVVPNTCQQMNSKQPTNGKHGGAGCSVPGSEGSPREWQSNPPQYSCLGNPMDKRSLVANSPRVCKESDMTYRGNNNQVFWSPLPDPPPAPVETRVSMPMWPCSTSILTKRQWGMWWSVQETSETRQTAERFDGS